MTRRKNTGTVAQVVRLAAADASVLLAFAALLLFMSFAPSTVEGACPNLCSGHGECSRPDLTCQCFYGWTGGDCSLRACKLGFSWSDQSSDIDTAHALTECSSRGNCDYLTGMCVCMAGFEGRACERLSCPVDCNGHGTCVNMEYYAQESDIYTEGKTYTRVWDAEKMYGCVCDEGYRGYDCSLRDCPVGDDPLTTGQFNEVQLLVCTATSGSFTLTFYKQGPPFRPRTTRAIPYTASQGDLVLFFADIAEVSVTYSSGTQACVADGSNVIKIEFRQNFGNLPRMNIGGDSKEHVKIYSAFPDFGATGESVHGITPILGTKENIYCSGRGFCDELTGVCTCYTAFQTSDGYAQPGARGDCGSPKGGITACPGASIACSGHGYCLGSPTFQCICSAGYQGGDCSERSCAQGKSWFDAPVAVDEAHQRIECSNMGVCDRTKGECVCRTNWEGGACERMSCPGGDPACSGHGQCLSMAQLAEESTIHSNGALTAYSYGKIPNYKFTWDYDQVYGCKCDRDYTGYDCSLRVCPRGDDPITGYGNGPFDPFQYKEIQQIQCSAVGGTFQLRFRTQVTTHIAATATKYDVEKAIEALYSIGGATYIGDVIIEYSLQNNTACMPPPQTNNITIFFQSELGNLPKMYVHSNKLGPFGNGTNASITSVTVREGNTENAECANRGICDRASGLCTCFAGFGSSNGNGRYSQAGTRGDCGYVLPTYQVTSE